MKKALISKVLSKQTFFLLEILAISMLFPVMSSYADIYMYRDDKGLLHLTNESMAKDGTYHKLFLKTDPPNKTPYKTDKKDVKIAQSFLSELGYDPGSIDGLLGDQTRKAIKAFQLDIGVPATGNIDQDLLFQLKIAHESKKTQQYEQTQIPKFKPRAYEKIPIPAEILPPIPSNLNKVTLNATELFQKVQASVYTVIASSSVNGLKTGKDILQGSAVAVSQKCLLTNFHVTENRPYILIIQGENYVPVRLSGMQIERDMCVLTVKQINLIQVDAIRSFDTLKVGEKVYTVGSPNGLEQTLGEGIISGLRKYRGQKLIQTSAPISSGSSGGGLFDVRGNLIGITTFLLKDSQNLNFAIAAEDYWE